jgi:hypothetical protein
MASAQCNTSCFYSFLSFKGESIIDLTLVSSTYHYNTDYHTLQYFHAEHEKYIKVLRNIDTTFNSNYQEHILPAEQSLKLPEEHASNFCGTAN